MYREIDTKQLVRQISFKLKHASDPPRFIYARESGSRGPYRFRIPVGGKKYEHRLLKGLRSRGLNPWIWTPKPVEQPSRFEQSTLYSVLSDLCVFFKGRGSGY